MVHVAKIAFPHPIVKRGDASWTNDAWKRHLAAQNKPAVVRWVWLVIDIFTARG